MAELPNLRLNLVNSAENVVVVRAVLSALAEGGGVGREELGDIRTAVTEACNNVVLHAYEGERGPMDVAIALETDAMQVSVRDRGIGIGEYAREDAPYGDGLGIGLHIIRTLARSAEFDEPPGRGTRVQMELSAVGLTPLHPLLAAGPEADLTGASSDLEAAIGVAPVALARTVLPRLTSTLAARAHFSTDRLSDVELLCDALATHAGELLSAQRLSLGVSVRPRQLELRLAPLRLGQAHGLLDASQLNGLGAVIEKLADRYEIVMTGAHETLAVGVLDRRRPLGGGISGAQSG